MAEDKGTEPVDEGMEVVPDAPLADVPTIIPELEDVVSQLATDVSFARKTWKDGSEGATPITAAELNRLEKGVADLTSTVNALRDSVSKTIKVAGTEESTLNVNNDGGISLQWVKNDETYIFTIEKTGGQINFGYRTNNDGQWHHIRQI